MPSHSAYLLVRLAIVDLGYRDALAYYTWQLHWTVQCKSASLFLYLTCLSLFILLSLLSNYVTIITYPQDSSQFTVLLIHTEALRFKAPIFDPSRVSHYAGENLRDWMCWLRGSALILLQC